MMLDVILLRAQVHHTVFSIRTPPLNSIATLQSMVPRPPQAGPCYTRAVEPLKRPMRSGDAERATCIHDRYRGMIGKRILH